MKNRNDKQFQPAIPPSAQLRADIGNRVYGTKESSQKNSHRLQNRGVNPGNLLIEASKSRCRLKDFGLVKSLQEENSPTHSGTVLGTLDFISPEQGREKAMDGRSDLYALGVVLYEMISGSLPFVADSPTGISFQHLYEQPIPLHTVAPQKPIEVDTGIRFQL